MKNKLSNLLFIISFLFNCETKIPMMKLKSISFENSVSKIEGKMIKEEVCYFTVGGKLVDYNLIFSDIRKKNNQLIGLSEIEVIKVDTIYMPLCGLLGCIERHCLTIKGNLIQTQ